MDWGLIGTILAIIFFGSTTILAIRVAKRKRPVWAYSTRHIIGRDAEAPLELKYIFGTREVTEVYKTTIIFFNMGNDKFCGDLVPIGNSDLNEAVIIRFKGAEILRPPSIQKTSKGVANNFSVEQIVKDATSAIQLHFPILNHNDGAIIDVWHTKYDDIDIPNAEITCLKEFIRKRPEGFWRNVTVPLAVIVLLLWVLGGEIAKGASLGDYVGLLVFVVFIIVFSVFGMRSIFRYRTFPSWSRQ